MPSNGFFQYCWKAMGVGVEPVKKRIHGLVYETFQIVNGV